MYWPVGTPRVYATSSSQPANGNITVSHDGLSLPTPDERDPEKSDQASLLTADSASSYDFPNPSTPITPITPGIQPVEREILDTGSEASSGSNGNGNGNGTERPVIPLHEPILALRVSRLGQIFAVITATSMTIWQAKPTVILAVVVRSEPSLRSYGTNVDLLLRPDSAIFVVHTSSGYLITYSLATDSESRVYKPYFTSHTNVQRRRQSHWGGPGHAAPDQIMWGPGEGRGVSDISVRFRMVIKVDAGIASALALDDEVVVATRKPAAVQCIRWTPDSSGSQTSTELLSKMTWLGKKVTVTEMTNDRSMNLSTWVTGDGRAYAVQRTPKGQPNPETGETDPKRLFKGYCFHVPQGTHDRATHAVINARFSLIALGCVDGVVRVYTVRDYSGNVPSSHVQRLPVSESHSGSLTSLSYSPDGYCLFVGYEKGWATWSVYGKPLSNSFGVDQNLVNKNGEYWVSGVRDASWLGGGSEILLVGQQHESLWLLEMARSAVTGCYSSSNVFRTVLQTTSSVMIYRGYDLPDMSTISAEPFLWHTTRIPATYLLNQWPIKSTVISSDGRYVAVAGRRGLTHYSVNSGRWKTFTNAELENEFSVRGGMCWYQNILVAAVEVNKTYELRLYSREKELESIVYVHTMPAPIVLLTPSGEDSLLVYTYDNLLYHFVFNPLGNTVRLVQVGQIAFHGIVRSPARVRGLSWILPESQLVEGDPSQDVRVASVLFLVDGKLVLLRPVLGEEGQLKYDMRVIAQNVEYYVSMKDQPFLSEIGPPAGNTPAEAENEDLFNSLWMFDGTDIKAWTDMQKVLNGLGESHGELPAPVSISVDFYPLSVLLEKAIVLGVEPDLVQRRDVNFSFFRFSIRTTLFLPEILRHHLIANKSLAALHLAQQFQHLEYFAHALEVLLHHVLDEEVDMSPPPSPESAILPRVLSLLSSFKEYLDIVVQCTRKTEVRSWRTLFDYLPPPQELFEESLQRGSLKTAGGYLLILHTFDELATASEQSVRLLTRAMREEDWELCKELARFLAALDETGDTLREALRMANTKAKGVNGAGSGSGSGSASTSISGESSKAESPGGGNRNDITGDGSSDASVSGQSATVSDDGTER
ncbi:RIC1-domain-containing protein [Cryphonectria parasitica EP155]|uniref:RIC1-domain-containing protein n=1 Tax=Cryphonectria parasitica (strain ATCC 38755 / EP155) TaxID=660469 RepID=A0A9P4Y1T3_CRYP1|nr:RIC1-domain-containing protein [Cryphonectria parasitica EP155]KAF3764772.1 RIC1-domain-containing protein [Cryphonectria parasitica EP155]